MYQNWPSKLHQLPFDQGIQIVINPSSVVYVPQPMRALSDGIFFINRTANICYDFIRIFEWSLIEGLFIGTGFDYISVKIWDPPAPCSLDGLAMCV